MLPNFVIIGAQKSASTFMHMCLAEHPQVYMPMDEIPYFESPDFKEQPISSLEKLFSGHEQKMLGIKRPSYIGKPEVPGNITQSIPNAKLIAVLRNPIDRAISSYYHNVNNNFVPARSVEKGMKLLLDGAYENKYKRAHEIIEFGLYYKYLKDYKLFFERNQILILLHEDIIEDKLGALKKAYDFLGIDNKYIPSSLNQKPQKVLYSIPRLYLLSMRNRFCYTYNHDRTRLFAKKRNLMDRICTNSISLLDRLVLSRIFKDIKPRLSQGLKVHLSEIYKSDIESCQSLIGRDLSHWM